MKMVRLHLVMLVIIGIALWVQDAHSQEIWGEYHMGSRHSELYWYDDKGERHEFNETNTGGGVSFGVHPNLEIGVGFFRNSYNNTSVYAGVDIHTDSRKPLRVGVSVAPITGYKDTPQDTHFMVLPNVVMRAGQIRTKVGIMPIGEIKLITLTVGVGF